MLLKLCLMLIFCIAIWTTFCKLLLSALIVWRNFTLTLFPIIVKFCQIGIFSFRISRTLAFPLNSFSRIDLLYFFHVIKMSNILFSIIILINVSSSSKCIYLRHFHFKGCCSTAKAVRFLIDWLSNLNRLFLTAYYLVSIE